MEKTYKILVTGTSTGFGFLTAKTLADHGHTVFAGMRNVASRNQNAANELILYGKEAAGSIHSLEMDVSDDHSVNAAVQQMLEMGKQIDVVVNNAGLGCGGWLEGFTTEQFQKIFNVNLFGVQRVNRAVLPHMRARKSGLLVYVSSIIGRIIMPFTGPYIASKFALEGLAETYHCELSPLGIETAIVEPGAYATNFGANVLQTEDEEAISSYGELTDAPEKMWGGMMEQLEGENGPNPQDVANAIAAIIKKPAGERPLRTVVDSLMGGCGVEKINDVCSEVQQQLMSTMAQNS
ncbi:MAG: SDR family oxidoreductase [SAR324 cluster bacterium]|nr:SDR family oxidoreductase [SAR324 cluster bacterium]